MATSTQLKVRDHVFAQMAGFALDGAGHGLSVVPGQTGSGKTYAAASVACAVALQDPALLLTGKIPVRNGGGLPRRLIYVTPLRKNRDAFIDEIVKFADGAGLDSAAVRERVYLVESAVDSAMGNIAAPDIAWPHDDEVLQKALAEFGVSARSFKQVELDIDKGTYNKDQAAYAKESAEEAVRSAEKNLRAAARNYCVKSWEAETRGEMEERPSLSEFCGDVAYDWVRAAWPAARTWEKRVFVMTPEKFMTSHDTVLNGSFTWMTARQPGQMLDGAMVIIDESDTTYARMLDKLIERTAKWAIDPVEYVQKLAHTSKDGFDKRDVRVVGRRDEDKSYGLTRFSLACGQATALYEEYGLASNFKLSDITGAKGAQLFSDGVSSSVRVDGEFKGLAVRRDVRNGKNWIVYPGRRTSELPKIETILKRLRGTMLLSFRGLLWMGKDLNKFINSRDDAGVGGQSLEQAISSVVAELHLADADRVCAAIELMAQGQSYEKRDETKDGLLGRDDLSIYSKGLSFIELVDSEEKCTLTAFEDMELLTSPEAMLCAMADCCKVALVSATAMLSQLHNFDLEYVFLAVDRTYGSPCEASAGLLAANDVEKKGDGSAYEVETMLYPDVADPLRVDGCWDSIGTGRARAGVARAAFEAIAEYSDLENTRKGRGRFDAQRERRVVAFVADCLERGVKSALVFNSAGAGEEKEDFRRGRLETLCGPLFSQVGEKANDALVFLDSSNWERGFAKVKRDLYEGKTRYIVLSYNTAGAGLNPQYPIGEADQDRVEPLPGRTWESVKDFEAVFIGKPTYLWVQGFNDDSCKTPWARRAIFLKGLWEQGVLYERGEQTLGKQNMRRGALSAGYSKRGRAFLGADLWSLPSIRGEATKIVNQAVGRITRTSMKTKHVFIGIDDNLRGLLDPSATVGVPTSIEYDAVVAALSSGEYEDSADTRKYEVTAARVNLAAVECEYRQALRRSSEWKPDEIRRREELWDTYLRFPTANEKEFRAMPSLIRRQGYVEMPYEDDSYWFSLAVGDESWGRAEFGFGRNDPFGREGRRLDAASTRLPELMRSPVVKAYFEDHGYATSWRPNRWIMPVGMAHNAYMGALGEAATRAWLESCCGLVEGADFGDMPKGKFELFDIYLPHLSEAVYIDAKNWHEGALTEEGYIAHVLAKLADCGGGYVVFAKALSPSAANAGMRAVSVGEGRIFEINGLFDPETGAANTRAAGDFMRLMFALRKGEQR